MQEFCNNKLQLCWVKMAQSCGSFIQEACVLLDKFRADSRCPDVLQDLKVSINNKCYCFFCVETCINIYFLSYRTKMICWGSSLMMLFMDVSRIKRCWMLLSMHSMARIETGCLKVIAASLSVSKIFTFNPLNIALNKLWRVYGNLLLLSRLLSCHVCSGWTWTWEVWKHYWISWNYKDAFGEFFNASVKETNGI